MKRTPAKRKNIIEITATMNPQLAFIEYLNTSTPKMATPANVKTTKYKFEFIFKQRNQQCRI